MDKQKQAAGETANNYPKRFRIFDKKGRANRDIITFVGDIHVETLVRNFAKKHGRRFTVRPVKGGER